MCMPVQNSHCHGHGHSRGHDRGHGPCSCSCMQVLSVEDEIKSLENAKQRMQEKLEKIEQKIGELRKIC
jgi:hypothetical protein